MQYLTGDDARSEDVPAPQVGSVYVMYAMCAGGSTMTVETKGVTGRGDASWTIECNSVPNRRQVHTAEDTRTENLRIVAEGSGTWGFLLAKTVGE